MDDTSPCCATPGSSSTTPLRGRSRRGNSPALTVHVESAAEIGAFWFLAFDGGDDELNACALLAEERDPGRFYGFWTYDPGLVSRLLDYLGATYG